jgi:hypothetical protein
VSANVSKENPSERRMNLLLWISMLGSPVIWLLFLQTGYALVQHACTSGRHAMLHLNAAVALTLVLAIGALSLNQWNKAGRGWPSSDEGGRSARRRTLSMMGILHCGLFALLILATWAAIFILHPCSI